MNNFYRAPGLVPCKPSKAILADTVTCPARYQGVRCILGYGHAKATAVSHHHAHGRYWSDAHSDERTYEDGFRDGLREALAVPECEHTGERIDLSWPLGSEPDERCIQCGAFRINGGPWIAEKPMPRRKTNWGFVVMELAMLAGWGLTDFIFHQSILHATQVLDQRSFWFMLLVGMLLERWLLAPAVFAESLK